jgi:acyl-[acyl-carrier-protein]-phospholipid O-acyltransferase/long-chain-fatty-acid--[acyl-carrier-protein] ligase
VIDTTSPMAIKAMINLVDQGKPVMIFPEGRITQTGGQMKVYDGPAFVAAKTGADVVVAHLDGLQYSKFSRMTGDFPKKWFPRVTITVCPPKTVAMPEGKTPRIRRRLAAEAMRHIMQEAAVYAHQPTTLYEAFLDAVELHGRKREMIEDITRKWTFGDLLKGSLALGRLVSKFTAPGERVAVMMPNSGALVSLLFGMFAFKRVPAVLNFTSGADGMQNACGVVQARTLLTSRAFVEKAKLAPVLEKIHGIDIRYLEDLRPTLTLGDKFWVLWALRNPRAVMANVKPYDPAVVLFTSGSEAKPKGVVLSHDSIIKNIVQAKAIIDYTSRDRFFTALPMFHSFGLCTFTILPLLAGAPIFLYPTPLHYRIIPELIYDRDCTVFGATATFLANYLKLAHPYDFRTMRLLIVGAEKLTEELRCGVMDKFGVRPIEGYGVTECAPVLAGNCLLAYKPGTVGQLLPGIEYKLEPVPGIEDGGVLHVRGPNMMLGYLLDGTPGELQPPSSIYGAGWYNTGDIVQIDAEGFIAIQGRMKRFAKVAGEMISLEVIEKIALQASPKYVHASAAAHVDGRGEMLFLFTQDPDLKRDQILRAAREMGAPEIAVPKKIIYIAKIPLLGTGKKDYVSLNKMAKEEAAK